jgi:ribonuclease R
MLPEHLSNGVCSLNPGVDRLAFSVFMKLDGEAKVIESRFARTLIRSSARLTYGQAMAVLEGGELPDTLPGGGSRSRIESLIKHLGEVAAQVRAARMANGALDMDMPECDVRIAKDGTVEDIVLVPSDASHQLVEECMVLANEAVAMELSRRRVPVLSRYHEKPRVEKLEELHDYLSSLGYSVGNLTRRKSIANFLRKIADDPLSSVLQLAVLKSLNRAIYSGRERGHFGLAKEHYLHFTSPIRRYPDLLMHRQLGALLEGEKAPWRRDALSKAGIHCSETEQNSERAERDLTEIKKFRYLESERGRRRVMHATVVNLAPFGLFVEVPELQIQGLVHASGLTDGRAFFNRRKQALVAGRDTFVVGDTLDVVVDRVDFFSRRVDFARVLKSGKKKG